MKPLAVLAVALLLAALAALAVHLVRDGGKLSELAAATEPSFERANAETAAPAAVAEPRQAAPGAPVETPAVATTALAAPDAAPDDRLTGRVVDERGAPVAGATVTVTHEPTDGWSVLDLWHGPTPERVGATRTDEDGVFALAVPAAVPLELAAEAPGRARARRHPVLGGEHVELVLAAGATLRGRVTRASTGEPVPDVHLELRHRDVSGALAESRTDLAGEYRFDGLPAGVITVDCEPPALAAPAWLAVELAPGQDAVRDLALAEGVLVHGTVTDAETGAPIADAEVGEGWFYRKTVRTDVAGEYRLAGFGGPGVYDVHVRAEGYGKQHHEFPYTDLPAETTRLDFALRPARRATGLVVDARGAAVAGAYVAAVANDRVAGQQQTDWISGRTAADGAFELRSLRPEMRHALFVRAAGHGTLVLLFPATELERAHVDLGRIELPAPARLTGRVVDAEGVPLPGLSLSLRGLNADHARLLGDGALPPASTTSYVDDREGVTDSRGRFAFADLAPGTYVLHVRRDGGHRELEHPVTIAAGADVEGLELVFETGLSIRGRVVNAAGEGLPRVGVGVRGANGRAKQRATSGAGGVFALHELEPGAYTLDADPTFFNFENDGPDLVEASLHGVPAGATEVELRLHAGVVLSGRVLTLAGEPASRAFVHALDVDDPAHQLAWAIADEEGAFALRVAEGAPVRLVARPSRPDETSPFGLMPVQGDDVKAELPRVVAPASDVEVRLPR